MCRAAPERGHYPCYCCCSETQRWGRLEPESAPAARSGPGSPRLSPPLSRALCWQRTLCGLREEHPLLVVLRPPAHTPFTRVQRLSCGLCLLLCSALVSLMFWEVPPQESPELLRLGEASPPSPWEMGVPPQTGSSLGRTPARHSLRRQQGFV